MGGGHPENQAFCHRRSLCLVFVVSPVFVSIRSLQNGPMKGSSATLLPHICRRELG